MLLLILKRVRTTTLMTLRKKEEIKISLTLPKAHLKKKEVTMAIVPQENLDRTTATKTKVKSILMKMTKVKKMKAQKKKKTRKMLSSNPKVKLRQSQVLHLSLWNVKPP